MQWLIWNVWNSFRSCDLSDNFIQFSDLSCLEYACLRYPRKPPECTLCGDKTSYSFFNRTAFLFSDSLTDSCAGSVWNQKKKKAERSTLLSHKADGRSCHTCALSQMPWLWHFSNWIMLFVFMKASEHLGGHSEGTAVKTFCKKLLFLILPWLVSESLPL